MKAFYVDKESTSLNAVEASTTVEERNAETIEEITHDAITPRTEFRTSRGQFQELEEVVTNLLATAEHLLDTSLDEGNVKLIKDIRDIRGKLIKKMYPQEKVNVSYHCAYKHMLLAKMQLKEVIQSRITDGSLPYDDEVLLSELQSVLNRVRAKYMNVDDTDPECRKCMEDYQMSSD